jgi:hypothetical protein
MMSFRKFLEEDMASAPSGDATAPPSPGQGEKTKPGNNKMQTGWREFGISDEDGWQALKHGEPIMSFEPLKVPGHPIVPSAPEPITVDDEGNGKVLYSVMNKEKFQNPNGTKYHGPIKDMPIRFGDQDRKKRKSLSISDIVLSPWSKAQGGMAGGMPGGPPPGGPMGGI